MAALRMRSRHEGAVSASGAVMNAESEWTGQSSLLADRRSTSPFWGKGKRKALFALSSDGLTP